MNGGIQPGTGPAPRVHGGRGVHAQDLDRRDRSGTPGLPGPLAGGPFWGGAAVQALARRAVDRLVGGRKKNREGPGTPQGTLVTASRGHRAGHQRWAFSPDGRILGIGKPGWNREVWDRDVSGNGARGRKAVPSPLEYGFRSGGGRTSDRATMVEFRGDDLRNRMDHSLSRARWDPARSSSASGLKSVRHRDCLSSSPKVSNPGAPTSGHCRWLLGL